MSENLRPRYLQIKDEFEIQNHLLTRLTQAIEMEE